jgi:osmoprotectant transport system permease protein
VALPVIVGGLRLATVTTIGLVTVTALIGQGGLGRLIVDGYDRFFATPLVVGATLSVALAFAADAAFVGVQRALMPWSRGTAG